MPKLLHFLIAILLFLPKVAFCQDCVEVIAFNGSAISLKTNMGKVAKCTLKTQEESHQAVYENITFINRRDTSIHNVAAKVLANKMLSLNRPQYGEPYSKLIGFIVCDASNIYLISIVGEYEGESDKLGVDFEQLPKLCFGLVRRTVYIHWIATNAN